MEGKIRNVPGAVKRVSSSKKGNPFRQSFTKANKDFYSRKPTFQEMAADNSAQLQGKAPPAHGPMEQPAPVVGGEDAPAIHAQDALEPEPEDNAQVGAAVDADGNHNA
jgi:hypothetical protein